MKNHYKELGDVADFGLELVQEFKTGEHKEDPYSLFFCVLAIEEVLDTGRSIAGQAETKADQALMHDVNLKMDLLRTNIVGVMSMFDPAELKKVRDLKAEKGKMSFPIKV